MKQSKKRRLLYILLAVAVTAVSTVFISAVIYRPVEAEKWEEGMVIFHESHSNQSKMLKWMTCSRWTHCGIVVDTPAGLQVLEAVGPVRLVSIKEFCSRGVGGDYIVCKARKNLSKPIDYKKYIDKNYPYDLQFKFDNGKMYCSELVWLIYKEQGIDICSPRRVGTYPLYWLPYIVPTKWIGKDSPKKLRIIKQALESAYAQIKGRPVHFWQATVAPSRLVNHMREVEGL